MKKKVFITKYALTSGISECLAEIINYSNGDMAVGKPRPQDFDNSCFHKGEFFLDKEEAVKHCNDLRDKKIKNLEKQIEKLKNLKFD